MNVHVLSRFPLSLLVRVLNSSTALLINAPGGTQRVLTSNKLKLGDVSAMLLTRIHPYFYEGFSGLLQTLCNNGPPAHVTLFAGDSRISEPLSILNSLAHTDYWTTSTAFLTADSPTRSCPPYELSAHFLDTNMPYFYTIVYAAIKRKLCKKKIRDLRLTGIYCRDLAAGRSIVYNGVPITPEDVSIIVTTRHTIILADVYHPSCAQQVAQAILDLTKQTGVYLICASEQYRPLLSPQLETSNVLYCPDNVSSLLDPGTLTAYSSFLELRRLWSKVSPQLLLPSLDECQNVETPSLTQYLFTDTVQCVAPTQISVLTAPLTDLDAYPSYSSLINKSMLNTTSFAPLPNLESPGILLLGTGASVPSKYRNVSGYVFISSSRQTVCIDPGEGTLQLLEWAAPGTAASNIIARLCLVYITHSHADHYLGIVSLVYRYFVERLRLETECCEESLPPLIIFADEPEMSYLLKCLAILEEPYLHMIDTHLHLLRKADPWYIGRLLSVSDLALGSYIKQQSSVKQAVLQFLLVPSNHITHSASLFLRDNQSQVAIGISGDTRPCESLIHGAKLINSDSLQFLLLIHEATFSASEQELAIPKGHSTITEAAEQMRLCGANIGVFTHFSQRYTKTVPDLDTYLANSGTVYIYSADLLWLPLEMCTKDSPSLEAWSTLATSLQQLYQIAKNLV